MIEYLDLTYTKRCKREEKCTPYFLTVLFNLKTRICESQQEKERGLKWRQ